jgi:uncharacterized OsmC-like protein
MSQHSLASLDPIATAVQRVKSVLQRRPEFGIHDDAPATARWQRGLRVVASHANGTEVSSDMPEELGGSGDHVTPGWLFRAGLASCATTSIALRAATEGIELTTLEVQVSSRSDLRGVLDMADEQGQAVSAGPSDVELHVRMAAPGVAIERLRVLVEDALRCSAIPSAVRAATPLAVHVEAG